MWLKIFIMIALIFGINACKDNEKNITKIETLKIKEIWQGDIPTKYQELLELEVADCIGGIDSTINLKDTFLLLPDDIESSSSLNVKLFGCWDYETTLECAVEMISFNTLTVNKLNTDKLILSVTQKRSAYNKKQTCPAISSSFKERYTQDINGSWEKGELQIVVNQDDENLSATVIVN